MDSFKIYDDDNPKPDSPATRTACLSDALDGRIVFLKQPQGFWIAAEDNPPELVTVWVAKKYERVAIAELEDDQPFYVGKLATV